MQSVIWYLRQGLSHVRNQRGAETAEWIVIVGLIAVVAFFIYPGALQAGLENVVNAVVAFITDGLAGVGV